MGEQLQGIGILNPLVMAGTRAMKACREPMSQSLEANGQTFGFIEFKGESTFDEIKRGKEACLSGKHDAIIACSGGKALDTGRAASAGSAVNAGVVPPQVIERVGANVSCIQVLSIAATDAPAKRLVSGMGDALAT